MAENFSDRAQGMTTFKTSVETGAAADRYPFEEQGCLACLKLGGTTIFRPSI